MRHVPAAVYLGWSMDHELSFDSQRLTLPKRKKRQVRTRKIGIVAVQEARGREEGITQIGTCPTPTTLWWCSVGYFDAALGNLACG